MDAGDWIALTAAAIALLVGVGSLIFTAVERKARETELRFLGTQVDLLRRQVEGEERDRAARHVAMLRASHGGISASVGHDEYEFLIVNGGPAVASSIDIWPRTATGVDVLEPSRINPPILSASQTTTIRLPIDHGAIREGPLTLWGRWRDDSGEHEKELLPIKVLAWTAIYPGQVEQYGFPGALALGLRAPVERTLETKALVQFDRIVAALEADIVALAERHHVQVLQALGTAPPRTPEREAMWTEEEEFKSYQRQERDRAVRLAEVGHDRDKLAAELRG